jgi:hypothetical protein
MAPLSMIRYLPASKAAPEKLPKVRVKALVKLLQPNTAGEPKNTGVKKSVGYRMIKLAAKAAAKRRARG